MSSIDSQATIRAIAERYQRVTCGSRELDRQAKAYLPGGDTRTSIYYQPYPAYMSRGEGCYLYDQDENRYIDFLNNYTSLIHGHAYAPVVEALCREAARGTALGAPVGSVVEHARVLTSRMPSLEQVRYCNSGTEATLFALRAARAYTGRDLIVKMDGGYHGTHDSVMANLSSSREEYEAGTVRPSSPGVPAAALSDTLVVPFNDLETMASTLGQHRGKVAAIITEQVMGAVGGIEPQPGFLQGLRDLADRHGALLIFDEVVTFRYSLGGMQEIYGVRPDLTALGKIIGGGLPVGGFGGRKDIMARFAPGQPGVVEQSGTFNGNSMTIAAGLATLEHYGKTEIARVDALGERLKAGFSMTLRNAGLKAQAVGAGSIVRFRWTAEPIRNARQAQAVGAATKRLPDLLHMALLNEGVFSARRGQFAISTPMTERDVDAAVAGLERALLAVRPYIVSELPHLLAL